MRQKALRESAGKESTFTFRNRPVDLEKIERYRKRNKLDFHQRSLFKTNQTPKTGVVCRTPPLLPKSLPVTQAWRVFEKLLFDVNNHIRVSFESGVWTFDGNERLIRSSPAQSSERSSLHAFLGGLDISCAAFAAGNVQLAGGYWRQGFREIETLVMGQYHDTIPNMIQKINDLNRQGQLEVAVLLKKQITRSSMTYQSPDRSRLSILEVLEKLDLEYMVEVEERVMQCYVELFDLYLGSQCYSSFVMLMNAARRKLTRNPSATFEECLPDLSLLDNSFGPSNQRSMDVVRLRVETLNLRGLHEQTEIEAYALVERAAQIQDDQWKQLYYLTKGWFYVGSAQYLLGKPDIATENLSQSLRCGGGFSRIDHSGLFNPERLIMLKYLEHLGTRKNARPEQDAIHHSEN